MYCAFPGEFWEIVWDFWALENNDFVEVENESSLRRFPHSFNCFFKDDKLQTFKFIKLQESVIKE